MNMSKDLNAEAAAGHGIVVNCNLGFGIRVEETEDGRANIYVAQNIITPDYDGPAIRAFMEQTAVEWLRQVAPHRLALGANER
jgi:hypothetical protein